FEALIGAVYLDGGTRAARKFIGSQFATEFADLKHASAPSRHNPKGHLQELLQARSPANPAYRVVRETGPDHSKQFEAIVEWQGRELGRGYGHSKKQAETAAAEAALATLQEKGN